MRSNKKTMLFHLTTKVQWFDSVNILLDPLIICMLLACIPFFIVMLFSFIFTYNKIKISQINKLNIFNLLHNADFVNQSKYARN